MISEYFKLAIKNLRKRKLRTWLTMIGIFISIATIFMLISLSLGLQNAVEEQFQTLGTDKFFVQPGTGFLGPPGSIETELLTSEDVKTIESVQGVKDVLETAAGNAKVEFNDKIRYFVVWGMSTKTDLYIETGNYKIDEGKFLESGNTGVLLGNLHKTGNLFGKPIAIGNKLTINDKEVKVRGILQTIGNPDDDKLIIMDIDAFRTFFNVSKRVDWIVVQVEEGGNIKDVADRVEKKLRNARGVTEKTQDFMILTPEELLKSVKTILNIITAFLAGIAAISLVVGAVGIANTMYTSVLERTKEIGVMKAIGATNKDILQIFLIESGLLGLIGAGIGVGLGYGLSKIIEYIAVNSLGTNLLQAAAPAYLVIGCLVFGFLIGAVSGALPALRASKIKVVDALRYE
jgi:putative ABC transport system permease protein